MTSVSDALNDVHAPSAGGGVAPAALLLMLPPQGAATLLQMLPRLSGAGLKSYPGGAKGGA